MEPNSLPEPVAPRPPKRRTLNRSLPWPASLLIILLVIGGLLGAAYYASLPKNGVEVESVDADVRQAITIGTSTRKDVLDWAANRSHTDVSDSFDPGGRRNGLTVQIANDSWMSRHQVVVQVSHDKSDVITKLSVFQTSRVDGPGP